MSNHSGYDHHSSTNLSTEDSDQVIENFGGTASGLTVAKLRKAKKLMNEAVIKALKERIDNGDN